MGKKCYLDVLEGTDKETGKIKTGLHIRMKSIPNSCIHYTANKEYGGSVVALYEDLMNGAEVGFDLLEGGAKCKFKNNKDISIESREEFVRYICFAEDKDERRKDRQKRNKLRE